MEIVDGRFVPDLVAVDAAQPVNFLNRDDVTHRVVKVSGPGQDFRSPPLEPGESFRLSLVGRGDRKLRQGTVIYRTATDDPARGRIAVSGTILPRSTSPPDEPAVERPERPDFAAKRRARRLAQWVSQCGADYRRCDTAAELVRNVGSGDSVRFVKGTTDVVESSVATHGPRVPVGDGPDETEIEATSEGFRIVSHSRTGRDFAIQGSGRDPEGWSRSWSGG